MNTIQAMTKYLRYRIEELNRLQQKPMDQWELEQLVGRTKEAKRILAVAEDLLHD